MKTPDIDERTFCLGDDCPQKWCELCPARKCKQMELNDNFRKTERGFYSSGLIEKIDPKTGKKKLAYARPYGD